MGFDIEMMEFDRMRLEGLNSEDYSDACDLYNRFGSRLHAIGIDSCEFQDQLRKLNSLIYDLNYSYTGYRYSSSTYFNSRSVLKSNSQSFSTFLYDWYRKLERLIDQAGDQGIVMDSRFSEKVSVRELIGRGN